PETLAPAGRLQVSYEGKPVRNLNELEWVRGRIYANVWHTDMVAMIDPGNGDITGLINLAGLLAPDEVPSSQEGVLNGIAYDAVHDRLFVTGKYWPKLFEIRVLPAGQVTRPRMTPDSRGQPRD
uniref:glutaminyl-peptide cyclotransferase n=1 Tax=Staphylococcus epidermidis TaxID=1282 RepID=UPI0027382D90